MQLTSMNSYPYHHEIRQIVIYQNPHTKEIIELVYETTQIALAVEALRGQGAKLAIFDIVTFHQLGKSKLCRENPGKFLH